MKTALILLNGTSPKKLPSTQQFDLVCATDGAFDTMQKLGVTPDLISGDFDSIENMPSGIEIIETPNQDYTDFHKLLSILFERNFTHVDIYGGSGKEQDHFLGNISTALEWRQQLIIKFFDDFGSFFFIENEFELTEVAGKTISLIPFPEANNIHTNGLKFGLQGENLSFGQRIGTRNKAVSNEIQIRYSKGNLLLYISN